jgi:hypothetical protein
MLVQLVCSSKGSDHSPDLQEENVSASVKRAPGRLAQKSDTA